MAVVALLFYFDHSDGLLGLTVYLVNIFGNIAAAVVIASICMHQIQCVVRNMTTSELHRRETM